METLAATPATPRIITEVAGEIKSAITEVAREVKTAVQDFLTVHLNYDIKKGTTIGQKKILKQIFKDSKATNLSEGVVMAALHAETVIGNDHLVKRLVKKGIDVNQVFNGRTALEVAMNKGKLHLALRLVKLGAKIERLKPESQLNLLKYAIEHKHLKAADMIIGQFTLDGIMNINSPVNKTGDTLLHLAAKMEGGLKIMDFLIEKGAHVNMQNLAGNTPLFEAVKRKENEVAEFLLENSADVNLPDFKGCLPIQEAVLFRNKPMIKLLVKHRTNLNPEAGPLFDKQLFDEDQNLVKFLVNEGAKVTHTDAKSNTPLHLAAASSNNLDFIKFLIQKDVDVNQPNNDGQTPLEIAIENRKTPIVHFLLEQGAHANVEERHLFHKAVKAIGMGNEGKGMIQTLILRGANINEADSYNSLTPFHLAIRIKNLGIVETMLRNWNTFPNVVPLNLNPKTGPSYITAALASGNAVLARKLISMGADVNRPDQTRRTPLQIAIERGKIEEVRFLLNNGASLENLGFTLLQLALIMKQPEIAQLLIEKGVDINTPIGGGKTLLHQAVEQENTEQVILLKRLGSRPEIQDDEGDTPLHAAARSGNKALFRDTITPGNISLTNRSDETARTIVRRSANSDFKNFALAQTKIM